MEWVVASTQEEAIEGLEVRRTMDGAENHGTEAGVPAMHEIGQWTPVAKKPEPIDFAKRAKADCKEKLQFWGAELIREGRRR